MKAEILQKATYLQAAALHECYSNLVEIYEDILGGTRNCAGIPEYHAAKYSRELCYRRMIEISDDL